MRKYDILDADGRVVAEQEKTVRLRALRLAKEEADRAAAAMLPPPIKKKARASRARPAV